MKLNARKLILDLLLATEGGPLSARDFIAACALFDIGENNVRVALVRLSADGLIEAAERGSYQLSESAHRLADEVSAWRLAKARLQPWQGGYLAVHCGGLGRSNRTALRRRNRALQMLGFRELDRGLYLRPDNMAARVAGVRQRLHTLGLEPGADVFVASGFDADTENRIRRLWDGQALNAHYRRDRGRLEKWMQRADGLETEIAARECYLLGGNAIREVVYDPLLPEPFVDTDARHDYFETVKRFDQFGKDIWRQLHSAGVQPDVGLEQTLAVH